MTIMTILTYGSWSLTMRVNPKPPPLDARIALCLFWATFQWHLSSGQLLQNQQYIEQLIDYKRLERHQHLKMMLQDAWCIGMDIKSTYLKWICQEWEYANRYLWLCWNCKDNCFVSRKYKSHEYKWMDSNSFNSSAWTHRDRQVIE